MITRQRLISLTLLITSGIRMVFWFCIMIFQLTGVGWVKHLSNNVSAVFFISLYANFATDLDATTASFAALFASDTHHDAEAARETLDVDYSQLEHDVARLAKLSPGVEGDELCSQICQRFPKVVAA